VKRELVKIENVVRVHYGTSLSFVVVVFELETAGGIEPRPISSVCIRPINAIFRMSLAMPIGPNQAIFGYYPRFGSGQVRGCVSREIQRRQTRRLVRALCPVI
jgi:hypothetical protein